MPVSFEISKADANRVRQIVARAKVRNPNLDEQATAMDLTACHANGTPMNFAKLAAADDFTVAHDVYGIANHLDRRTGKLGGHFLPRCAR